MRQYVKGAEFVSAPLTVAKKIFIVNNKSNNWRSPGCKILSSQTYYFSDEGANWANNSAPVMFLVSLAKE